jgi:hemolysin III
MNQYSTSEERLNVISHFIGLILSAVALYALLTKAFNINSIWHIISYSVFGISMIILYLASTLYHNSTDTTKRKRLKVFDHSAIYVLIAGTYTPFALITLNGSWGWWILGIIWSLAFAGVILKLFFAGRFMLASTIGYVLMGWVVVIAFKPLLDSFSTEGLTWLFTGGAFYTLGAVLYQIKRIPYNHAIFHIFVLLGTWSHFMSIYYYT